MSLDDVFGPFEGRPQHPDFAKLVDVVLQHDGKTEDRNFDYEGYLRETMDPASLVYMANGRAKLFLARKGKNPALNGQLVAMVSSGFVDGFVVGFNYRARQQADALGDLFAACEEQVRVHVERAKAEILADIDEGRVPATVHTFSELHDHVDANEYGGLNAETDPELWIPLGNAVQAEVDVWLRAGRPDND